MVVIMTLLTATSHLWHQWWQIFLSTSLCVFTLPDQIPCNVWRVRHGKQEMPTPRAPDLTFFWGFTLLHGLDFFNQFCLCPLDFMLLGNQISEFVLFWIICPHLFIIPEHAPIIIYEYYDDWYICKMCNKPKLCLWLFCSHLVYWTINCFYSDKKIKQQ